MRRMAMVVVGIVAATATGVALWPRSPDTEPATRFDVAATDLAQAPELPPVPPRWGAVAIVPSVAIFDGPGEATPRQELSHPTHEGVPRVFSVLERRGDWLEVLLNIRPNSTTGWIRAADVQVHDTPHRIVVDRAAHTLTLLQQHEVVFSAPVAVGTGRTPTPVGTFYIDAIVPTDPNGIWGAFQLSVSGFSEVYKSFMGGSGQIAIHGTNRPSLIGQDVSNGCVRMRNADITEVANRIVLGTPVDIVN